MPQTYIVVVEQLISEPNWTTNRLMKIQTKQHSSQIAVHMSVGQWERL